MKKIFSMAALFAAGLLGFTSCSNEDIAQGGTPDAQTLASNGIYFKVDDNSAKSSLAKGPLLSRAAGVTTTSLTNIYVQATNSENAVYFGDGTPELFTYDGSSVFRSTVNHYWPNNNADGANNTLNFYASNQQEALTAGTQANPSPIVDDYECDGIKDWVTATVKAGEKTIPYPLTFQHVLSQIKITAEAKDKTQDLVYKVVGVKLSAPDTGDYQFANATAGVGTWTIDNSSSADYTYEQNMNGTFNPTAATEADQTWASTDYFNILPVTSGTLTFDVQYQVIQNGQVIGDFTGVNSKQVTVDAPNLLSGKIYTYNFVLAINTNDVITFTVNTTAWGSGSTTDVQVPETPDALVVFNIPTDNYKQIIGVYDGDDWEQNKLVCDYITVDGNKIKVTSSLRGNPIYTFSAGEHTIEYYFYTGADNIHHKIFSSGFLDATSTSNTSLNNVVSVTFSDQVILAPQLWDIDYSFNTFFKGTKTLWQEKLNSLPSWLTMASYKTHFKNGVVHCIDGDYVFE